MKAQLESCTRCESEETDVCNDIRSSNQLAKGLVADRMTVTHVTESYKKECFCKQISLCTSTIDA